MPAQIFLYDADGCDRVIESDQIEELVLTDHQLVWVDIADNDCTALSTIGKKLAIEPGGAFDDDLSDIGNSPQNFGDYIRFVINIAPATAHPEDADAEVDILSNLGPSAQAQRVMFIVGPKWLVTVHVEDIGFLRQFREQDRGETMIGALSPAGLAASLLDWALGDYFDAVSIITSDVDKLDERVLRERASKTLLGRIVTLRRRTSRIRELLVCNRAVFYGLSRPDLTIIADSESAPHYLTLTSRFERAVDEVEHVRDLINGSFDLFSSRNGIQTNALVKVLTIVTAVLGYAGAVAGIFGMNVKASVFEGGNVTFAVIIGTVIISSALALLIARGRRWI
jgi:magnesium transporter